ncbi:hypothetical protein SK128_001241 [Halocaridina rubra]|uniref:Uncharacterized protein n=1 Tax=Halocaridina rubra TaxID=373956 RepID=A0AAN9AG31_HALRR
MPTIKNPVIFIPQSILMTALSSLLALGVMPFNLWLYSMLWTTQKMNVPYANVLISLAFVTVPVLAGMVVRHFKKKWAAVVSKVCGLLGWLGALISGVLVCVIYWDSITTCSTHLLIIGATIPLLGAVAAYVISKIICFSHATCRTLAIETGSQNMVVAINVMLLSFTEPNIRGKMVIFPVLYGLFMLLEVAIAVGIYLLWSFFQQERVIEERVKTKIDNSILTSVPVPAHRLSESKIQKMTGFTLTPDLCQLQQEREEQLRREMATTTYHRFSESPRQPLDDLQLDEVEPILSYSASPRPNEETKMSPSQKPTTKNTLSDDSTDSTLPLYGRPQSPVYFKFPQVPNRSNQPFSGGGDDRDRRPFFKESYTFNPSHSPVSPTLSNKGVPNMFPVTEDDFRPSPGEESPPATAPYGSPIPIPKEKRIDWNQAIADVPSSPDPLTPKATLNSTKSFGFYHNDVRIGQSDQFNTFGRRKNAS